MPARRIVLFLLAEVFALPPAFARQNAVTEAVVRKSLSSSSFKDVQISIRGNIVTLTGTVNRFRKVGDAEEAVSRIHGIGVIHNEIQVAGPTVPDAELRKKVTAAMAYSVYKYVGYLPDFSKMIDIQVQDGVVLLSGSVSGDQLAADIYRSVAATGGVKNLIDRIQVAPGSPLAPKGTGDMGTGVSQ